MLMPILEGSKYAYSEKLLECSGDQQYQSAAWTGLWPTERMSAWFAEGPRFNTQHLQLKDKSVSDTEDFSLRDWRASGSLN